MTFVKARFGWNDDHTWAVFDEPTRDWAGSSHKVQDEMELSLNVNGQLVSQEVTIQNRLGLHARPAMSFVDVANRYKSQIQVSKGDQTVDGKSIMQMMMLAATQGTVLKVDATGADAASAIEAIRALVDRKFDEE